MKMPAGATAMETKETAAARSTRRAAASGEHLREGQRCWRRRYGSKGVSGCEVSLQGIPPVGARSGFAKMGGQ